MRAGGSFFSKVWLEHSPPDADRYVRVLHVSCYLDPAGREPAELLRAWPALTGVAAAAARVGMDVAVVQAASRTVTLKHDEVPVHFVQEARRSQLARWRSTWAAPLPVKLAAVVERLRPELIHFHSLSLPRHALYLQRRLPAVPMLVQDHLDRLPPRWRRWISRRGLEGVAAVAFTAREQATDFIDAGVLSNDTPVFELLESSSQFTPGSQREAREQTGVHGDPSLLWVGRLNRNKDPLMVLEAVSRVLTVLPEAHLWCCYTTTELLSEIQGRLATEPQLASRVHLLGAVPHERVEALCRAADFFVLGSHKEGSGFAVIEAMACGLVPLLTDIPSFRRMTRDAEVGVLVPPGDAEAMAHVIVEWSQRDRTSLRTAARKHFEKYLSFEVIGTELRGIYESILRST